MVVIFQNAKTIELEPQEFSEIIADVANRAAFDAIEQYARQGEYFSKTEAMQILGIKRAEMDRLIQKGILASLPRCSKDEKMQFKVSEVLSYRRRKNKL